MACVELWFCLSSSSSATNWASGEDDHVVARAEFDFSAASDEEISLRAGDMINLAPKGDGPLKPFYLFVNNFLCYFRILRMFYQTVPILFVNFDE